MEIWKDIKNYEGLYQVSNYGRIRSLPRKNGFGTRKQERILKTDISKRQNGVTYHRVTLCKNGLTKRFSVHRLVAEAFIPNLENKCCVNHIDSNPSNNHINNLEWVSYSENMEHAFKQGRLDNSVKSAGRKNRKLTMEQVEEIKKIKKENPKKPNRVIGEQFGVSRQVVDRILKGQTYGFA